MLDHPLRGLPIANVVALELFAGTARLTATLRNAGFSALGVDRPAGKTRTVGPCVRLDQTQVEAQRIVLDIIKAGRVLYVHMAPPCGTASRAREKPIPPGRRAEGAPQPKPLRSAQFPGGLPTLQGADLARVEAANTLYAFVAETALLCAEHHATVSIENPRNSWMWSLPALRRLVDAGWKDILFQHCMHGGCRPKWTRWRTNSPAFVPLALSCDGGHEHLAFDVRPGPRGWSFDTSEEAAYPPRLCANIARCVLDLARAAGVDTTRVVPNLHMQRSYTGRQHRLRSGVATVPEYANSVTVLCGAAPSPPGGLRLPPSGARPAGARGIGIVQLGNFGPMVERSEDWSTEDQKALQGAGGRSEGSGIAFELGIFHTPVDFVAKALRVGHPFEADTGLPDATLAAIRNLLVNGPAATTRMRAAKAASIAALAASLEPEEAALHKELHPDVACVLKGKRIILWRRLLKDTGYPDLAIADMVTEGFRVTGLAAPSGVYAADLRPPSIPRSDLLRAGRWLRPSVLSAKPLSLDIELDAEVLRLTLAEVEAGWLRETSLELLQERYGEDWIPNRRFGVRQGGKVRCVDDFSASLVNSAFGVSERISLGGIDEVAAAAKLLRSAGVGADAFLLPAGDGEGLAGTVHPDFAHQVSRTLLGGTLDLASAYKQLPIHPDDAALCVIACHDPHENKVRLFETKALPFGAGASVTWFNRVARSLWWLGARLLDLVWGQFFDDFPQLEPEATVMSAWLAADFLCQALGWRISQAKRGRPQATFTCLGVDFAFPPPDLALVTVANKKGRAEEVSGLVDEAMLAGRLSPAQAASLAGKFVYLRSQLFGRVGVHPLRVLFSRALGMSGTQSMDEELRRAMRILVRLVVESPPRTIQRSGTVPPLVLFTDGAAEGEQFSKVTVGGILFDPVGGPPEFFGTTVSEGILGEWREKGLRQVIGQAEVYPYLLARRLWRTKLKGRSLTAYIDNDSARFALIRGESHAAASRDLLAAVAEEDVAWPVPTWFARCPSESNPADAPSRLDFAALLRSFPEAVMRRVVQPTSLSSQRLSDDRP